MIMIDSWGTVHRSLFVRKSEIITNVKNGTVHGLKLYLNGAKVMNFEGLYKLFNLVKP